VVLRGGWGGEAATGAPPAVGGSGCRGGADFDSGGKAHPLFFFPLSNGMLFSTGDAATIPVGISTVVTCYHKLALHVMKLHILCCCVVVYSIIKLCG
jgi:hypothetical protein